MTIHDILYKKGEQEDGRAIWTRCGVMIEKDNGKRSIKLDVLPLGQDWDGWLVVCERRPREEEGQEARAPEADDGIPF